MLEVDHSLHYKRHLQGKWKVLRAFQARGRCVDGHLRHAGGRNMIPTAMARECAEAIRTVEAEIRNVKEADRRSLTA